MKQIIQYSQLLGERLHLKKIFSNSLFIFYQFQNLSQKHPFSEYLKYIENQQNRNFCWFFFASPSVKKQYIK